MSWSLSASGHDPTENEERVLLADLAEVFSRHPKIIDSLTFTGASGSLNLGDVVPQSVVVPMTGDTPPADAPPAAPPAESPPVAPADPATPPPVVPPA
jgi:hypothetical protein